MQRLEVLREEFYNELGIEFTDDQYVFLNNNKFNTLSFVRNIRFIKTIKLIKKRDVTLNFVMIFGISIFFSFPFILNNMLLILKLFWVLISISLFFYSLKFKKYKYKIIVITSRSDLIQVEVDAIYKNEAKEIVAIIKKRISSLESKLIHLKAK